MGSYSIRKMTPLEIQTTDIYPCNYTHPKRTSLLYYNNFSTTHNFDSPENPANQKHHPHHSLVTFHYSNNYMCWHPGITFQLQNKITH